jgi:hypothetical protein
MINLIYICVILFSQTSHRARILHFRFKSLNMSSPLSDILRETIALRFVRDDSNKLIVAISEISLRQMQKMKSN